MSEVVQSFDEWLLALPHIYDRGDGRVQCEALKALDDVAKSMCELSHCLIRGGEAALSGRLEKAFQDVQRAARTIWRFVKSGDFSAREWLDGDTEGQAALSRVRDQSIDLVEQARELHRTYLREDWSKLLSLRQVSFWLAWNLRLRDTEVKETRQALMTFLAPSRLPRERAQQVSRSAIWRAYGRLALGFEYFERRVGRRKLQALHRFSEELQLASTPPAPPAKATPDAPAVGFLRIEDIRPAYRDLDEPQLDRLRKRLEQWRKTNEDSVLISDEDPASGRRRYAYPADVVRQKVREMLVQQRNRDA